MSLRSTFLALAWAVPAVLTGCLPNDTRPSPGKLLVTVSPDEALSSGMTTADGWQVSFERFLVSLGRVSVDGDGCLAYSDPDYSRVLDLRQPGPQKLSLVYAVGHCDFDMELSSPQPDNVLGPGTTEADRTFLRTPGDDAFTQASGISIHAEGTATRGAARTSFAWSFRHRIDYAGCSATVDGREVKGFDIASGESRTLDVLIRGAALFSTDRIDMDAETWFQPYADADALGDRNGVVALDELSRIDLAGAGADAGTDAAVSTSTRWATLEDFLYLGLFPLVPRFRGNGTCAMEVFPNDRVPR